MSHFESKGALAHVLGKRAEGLTTLTEASHGTEMPGHISSGADAAKESAVILLLFLLFLSNLKISFDLSWIAFLCFGMGWLAWKMGRSGWLGWSRLERLHRLIEQEKYEIEHHRPQEREELIALYRLKGFDGKLLDEVVDVLMADQDRLLKVMLEEEMGLTLQVFEHPLQQTLGAGVGTFAVLLIEGILFYLFPKNGPLIGAALILIGGAILSASFEKNKVISAVVWNLTIGALAYGVAYFLFGIFL